MSIDPVNIELAHLRNENAELRLLLRAAVDLDCSWLHSHQGIDKRIEAALRGGRPNPAAGKQSPA